MIHKADSIIYDVEKIARYRADGRFDYNSQFDAPDISWFEMLSRWFNRFINSLFSGSVGQNVTTPIMVIAFITALVAALYFLYKKRPELFMRSRKTKPVEYEVEEENIHEIDFGHDISAALDNCDYRLAVRLIYLHTLRLLSDNDLIIWQIHKTPTEYIYEVSDNDLRQFFRELTNIFLHVRYGNRLASLDICETMRDLQTAMLNIIKSNV